MGKGKKKAVKRKISCSLNAVMNIFIMYQALSAYCHM